MRKFKRLTLTLALLITAVGGAWAQSSLNVVELEAPAEWETDESNLTPADLPGFYTSTFDKAKAWKGAPTDGAAMLIYAFEGDDAHYVYFDKGTPEDKDYKFTFTKASVLFMTKIYYTVEPANPTEWLLTPDADKKVWTLYKMPASNIELQVEYCAESNLFLSKEALADKTKIAVTAGDLGVQFGDDGKSANTVTEGTPMTVKFSGTKKVIGVKAEKKAAAAPSVSFTVKRVGGEDPNYADGNYTVAPGTTWQQFIESGDAPACLSIGTYGMYSGKVCHDMNGSLQECGGTIIANVADKKRVKISDAIIDGATYGCSDYLGYLDHD